MNYISLDPMEGLIYSGILDGLAAPTGPGDAGAREQPAARPCVPERPAYPSHRAACTARGTGGAAKS